MFDTDGNERVSRTEFLVVRTGATLPPPVGTVGSVVWGGEPEGDGC